MKRRLEQEEVPVFVNVIDHDDLMRSCKRFKLYKSVADLDDAYDIYVNVSNSKMMSVDNDMQDQNIPTLTESDLEFMYDYEGEDLDDDLYGDEDSNDENYYTNDYPDDYEYSYSSNISKHSSYNYEAFNDESE